MKNDIKRIIRVLKQPIRIIRYLGMNNYISIDDEIFLKISYKCAFNKKLNLDNPQTFNEKLQWLKLYDRNPKYTKMVDKYEVKEYVSNIIGKQYIIPTLGVWDKFENIDFEKLPNQFVLKCTHDSGGIVICKDKNKFNYKDAERKINECLKRNYYYAGREWPYKNVKPRIIAEKYMEQKSKEELKDYKIMCFSGRAKCSFVCSDRYSKEGLKVTFFDLNWNKLPFERHYPSSSEKIDKPSNYNLMIKLSEELAQDIPFIRVDWYEIDGKLYFGELTFYPGSGFEEFTPKEWDTTLGS